MSKGKIFILIGFLLLIGVLLYLGPEKYLNLEYMKSKLDSILTYKRTNPVTSATLFSAVYITITAASIPGAAILTLLAGAVFGFAFGSLIAITSATIGATIAFLIARYLFDDLVQQKMGDRIGKIRENFRREGALYLFSLRLVPVVPFFVINLVMGLTTIKTRTYMIASFVGMLPGTMVFINAGTQLSKLESIGGLVSPTILASFALLAVFPYLAKYLLKVIKSRAN
ncbi:MAG: TVP38/TMEM64 family protein [Gammaproteobacteria bacterium]|nr:TVP38/TMEM64 family protein [Gammaproteobacteria bacterium]